MPDVHQTITIVLTGLEVEGLKTLVKNATLQAGQAYDAAITGVDQDRFQMQRQLWEKLSTKLNAAALLLG